MIEDTRVADSASEVELYLEPLSYPVGEPELASRLITAIDKFTSFASSEDIPAEFVLRVREIHAECAARIAFDDQQRNRLWREGLVGQFVASMELGWWLRDQVFGADSPHTYAHIGELVRALNLSAVLLLQNALPQPMIDEKDGINVAQRTASITAAGRYLGRAILLTDPQIGPLGSDPAGPRLRAAALNNLGCLRKRRGDLPGALTPLEDAAAALRAAGAGQGQPLAAHGAAGLRLAVVRLNLAAVLAAAGAGRRALGQAESAAAMLERAVLTAEDAGGYCRGDSDTSGEGRAERGYGDRRAARLDATALSAAPSRSSVHSA